MLVILHRRFSSDEDSGVRLKGGADYKRKDVTVNISTVFPHIVAAATILFWIHLVRKLFKFSLRKGKLNEETIWNFQAFMNSKKNSCRGNYMRKYGRSRLLQNVEIFFLNH